MWQVAEAVGGSAGGAIPTLAKIYKTGELYLGRRLSTLEVQELGKTIVDLRYGWSPSVNAATIEISKILGTKIVLLDNVVQELAKAPGSVYIQEINQLLNYANLFSNIP